MTEIPESRKIHVDLPREVHRKLRIQAALHDVSLQAFVSKILADAVRDIEIPPRLVAEPDRSRYQASRRGARS